MKSSIWNGIALAVGAILLVTLGPLLARELSSLPHSKQLAARADARVVTLDIGGMHCSGCVASVRKELEAVPGVAGAQVQLGSGRATVVCDRAVADSSLVTAVHRAGPGFTAAPARD